MLPHDVFRARLEATIASLRYWVPTIADTATASETAGEGYWRIAVAPHVAQACPFALMLRADQMYDLVIAGETFEDRPISALDMFVPLATAIAEGRVVRRQTYAAASGRLIAEETIVDLGNGGILREVRPQPGPNPGECEVVVRDRHFLPYRR